MKLSSVISQILTLFICVRSCRAQNSNIPEAIWLLPGATYQVSSSLKLSAQYGRLEPAGINVAYLQGFLPVGKTFIINPGYLGLISRNGIMEHGLINGFSIQFHFLKFLVDDRNLMWNRFAASSRNLHFYRNRLRISRPFVIKKATGKFYVFDEGTYFFNRGRWSRNRIAIGWNFNLLPSFGLDVFFARESDVSTSRTNLFFILGTIQFQRKAAKCN